MHLDPVLHHFNADSNFVGMTIISVGSLIAWLVATLLISSSNIDILTEKKPFSLSLYHDRSIIVAVISSLVVGFLGPLSVMNKEITVADYAKTNAQIVVWMLTVVSLVWAGRIALELLLMNISGQVKS